MFTFTGGAGWPGCRRISGDYTVMRNKLTVFLLAAASSAVWRRTSGPRLPWCPKWDGRAGRSGMGRNDRWSSSCEHISSTPIGLFLYPQRRAIRRTRLLDLKMPRARKSHADLGLPASAQHPRSIHSGDESPRRIQNIRRQTRGASTRDGISLMTIW